MTKEPTCCRIEHHAVLFALLAKHAVQLCEEKGKEAVLRGMTVYGKERGRRMAWNAVSRGDEINTWTNQAYGEWKPDYAGQMEFGQIRIQPTLQTYISRCAWCDAWKKYGLTEYGKLYCVNVDNAVYQGYQDRYLCTQVTEPMSWGSGRCEFDWGAPLTEEENQKLAARKKELGDSCMKDFNFHTAHLLRTVGQALEEDLKEDGRKAVQLARKEFAEMFGQEYLDVLDQVPQDQIYPPEVFPERAE